MPTLSKDVAQYLDPYIKHSVNTQDRVQERIPGQRDEVQTRHNLWGEPISTKTGLGALYGTLSPIYANKIDPEPIETELLRIGYSPGLPTKTVTHEGVKYRLKNLPHVYERFVVLSGGTAASQLGVKTNKDGSPDADAKKMLRNGDHTLLEALNALVNGDHELSALYAESTMEDKASMIQKQFIEPYRKGAKLKLLEEFPDAFVPPPPNLER